VEATATRGARNPVGRAFRILFWMAPRDDGPWGVREIAKGHGGTAEARSDDRRTVFTVRLPRRK